MQQDSHWDINNQIKRSNHVHACLRKNHDHLNLTYSLNGK